MAAITFPADPLDNQVYKAENEVIYVYKTDKWISAGAISDKPPTELVTIVGPQSPENPIVGNLWFNTNAGILYVWYQDADQDGDEGQWTDVRPPETFE